MIIFETENVYQEKNSCKQNKSHNIVFDAINKKFLINISMQIFERKTRTVAIYKSHLNSHIKYSNDSLRNRRFNFFYRINF
jgi:hypothetical protein